MFGGGYRQKVVEIRRAYDGIVEGNEYQAVIFKAMRKLLESLCRFGFLRFQWETVRHLARMVAVPLPVDKRAMGDFIVKFEEARYSDRAMGEPDRDAAIQALRAVQYSIEKFVLANKQLAMIEREAVQPPDGSRPMEGAAPDLWVVSPDSSVENKVEPGKKYRFAVMPRDSSKEAVMKEFGVKNVSGGSAAAPAVTAEMRKLLAAGDILHLGERLVEMTGKDERRVFVHRSLVSYLLEFQQRGLEAGLFHASPSAHDPVSLLRAAQVLSLSEGRDFMVPDDLKVALLSAGPRIYHMSDKDARLILDEEIREIEAPKGLFSPKPEHTQGLPVPFV